MTDTKFTPGPWVASHDRDGHVVWMAGADEHPWEFESHLRWECNHLIDEDEECDNARNQFQQSKANAHLIAAAPDLYEALAEIMNHHASNVLFGNVAMAERAWNALAKARGES